MLLRESATIECVVNALGQLKAIGHTPEAKPLPDNAEGAPVTVLSVLKTGPRHYFDRDPIVRVRA